MSDADDQISEADQVAENAKRNQVEAHRAKAAEESKAADELEGNGGGIFS